MLEYIRVAISGLSSNKLRSALTMLGITIGVAAVILLVSLGQAVENFILGQFSDIGTNLVFVFGQVDEFGRPQPLTQSDAEALSDIYRVPDAARIAASLDVARDFRSPVSYEGNETTARVIGTPPIYFEVVNRKLLEGRLYDEAEETGAARVAVIGLDVVEKLFNGEYPIGRSIRVEGVRFQVIGILEEAGSGGTFAPGGGLDNYVYIPLKTAQTRLAGQRTTNGEWPVTGLVLQARDENSVEAVVDQVRQTLREERGISFRDEDDFEVATQEDLLSSLGTITSLLTVFLGVIAGISLLVGGIGIMNIMLVTVTERTREIGLRKAVGAQKFAILLQFLTEATVLALVGGAIGTMIAIGLAYLISSAPIDLSVSVQPSSVMLATTISVIIGIFFGIYPANRAAGLNPIDALRYE